MDPNAQQNPAPPVQPQPSQPIQQLSQPAPNYGHKSSALKWIWIIVLIIILILAVVAFFARDVLLKSQQVSVALPTPTVEVKPSPTPSDETANWKTYTDGELGLSFKYPQNWEYQGNQSEPGYDETIDFLNNDIKNHPGTAGGPTFRFKLTHTLSLNFTLSNERNNPIFTESHITVGGLSAYEFANKNGLTDVVVQKNNSVVYIFSGFIPQAGKIYPTIKFTDQTQATDANNWKTFTPDNKLFTVSYPYTWYKGQEQGESGPDGTGYYLVPFSNYPFDSDGGNGSKESSNSDHATLTLTVTIKDTTNESFYTKILALNLGETTTISNVTYSRETDINAGNKTFFTYSSFVKPNGTHTLSGIYKNGNYSYSVTLSGNSDQVINSNKAIFENVIKKLII